MNKIMEGITVSTQIFPTTSAAISGSAVVDMAQYRHVIAKLYAHKLPDQKGEGVITLSLYESTGSLALGTYLTASAVTGTLTSVSDIYLEKELKVEDMSSNAGKRYLVARVVGPTPTAVACTIERAQPRYEDV